MSWSSLFYHDHQIGTIRTRLREPLLKRNNTTQSLEIALNPDVITFYREIDWLRKNGIKVPKEVVELSRQTKLLKPMHDKLNVS